MALSITLILIIGTSLISWQAFNNPDIKIKFRHYPFEEYRDKEYYRWVTSMFLHADWTHLILNMFVLYGFGTQVENWFIGTFGELMGRINFFALYILSGIFADIPTYYKNKNNSYFSSLGASGATSGILFAAILYQPWQMLGLFFIIPVPGIIAAILYLVYSSYAARNDVARQIDHEAHFWGAVFGFLFTIALKPEFFTSFMEKLVNGLPF